MSEALPSFESLFPDTSGADPKAQTPPAIGTGQPAPPPTPPGAPQAITEDQSAKATVPPTLPPAASNDNKGKPETPLPSFDELFGDQPEPTLFQKYMMPSREQVIGDSNRLMSVVQTAHDMWSNFAFSDETDKALQKAGIVPSIKDSQWSLAQEFNRDIVFGPIASVLPKSTSEAVSNWLYKTGMYGPKDKESNGSGVQNIIQDFGVPLAQGAVATVAGIPSTIAATGVEAARQTLDSMGQNTAIGRALNLSQASRDVAGELERRFMVEGDTAEIPGLGHPEPKLAPKPQINPIDAFNGISTMYDRANGTSNYLLDPNRPRTLVEGRAVSNDLIDANRVRLLSDEGPTTPTNAHPTPVLSPNEALPVPPAEPRPTQPADVHAAARQIDPGTMNTYDALVTRRDSYRKYLDDLQASRQQDAEANAPHADAIADLQRRMDGANARMTKIYEARLQPLLDERQAAIDAAVNRDSPDMALVRRKLIQNDYAMRDMAEQVSAVYAKAREMVPEPKEMPSPTEPLETPVAQATPVHEVPAASTDKVVAKEPTDVVPGAAAEVDKAPNVGGSSAPNPEQSDTAAHLQMIKDDIVNKLTSAGHPEAYARAAAEVWASRYNALAAAYEGKKGTAWDLYKARNLQVKSGERVGAKASVMAQGQTLEQPLNAGVDPDRQVPVVDVSHMVGGTGDFKELMAHLKAMIGQKLSTADEQHVIEILNNRTNRHVSWSSRAGADAGLRSKIIHNIADIIAHAPLIESAENLKPEAKPDAESYHRFYVPIWDGSNVRVLRVVAERAHSRIKIDPNSLALYDVIVEREGNGLSPTTGSTSDLDHSDSGIGGGKPAALTIREMLSGVNDIHQNPYFPDHTLDQSSVDQSDSLTAIHNISAEGLQHADALGGLPVPSIGVTKAQAPFTGFGGISLVGHSGLIDPRWSPVYSGDAYSPRFPERVWKPVAQKQVSAFQKELEPFFRRFDEAGTMHDLLSRLNQLPDRDKAISKAAQSAAMAAAYLESKGIKVDPVMAPVQFRSSLTSDPALVDWVRAHLDDLRNASSSSALWDEFSKEATAAAHRLQAAKGRPTDFAVRDNFNENGHITVLAADRLLHDIDNAVGKTTVDSRATHDAVTGKITDQADYYRWVGDKIGSMFEAPGVKVGKKIVPLTLESAVDAMTGPVVGREKTMTHSNGQVIASGTKRFKSLEELQANRDKIASEADYRSSRGDIESALTDFRTSVVAHYTGTNWRGEIDTWDGMDAAGRALSKAAKKGGSAAALKTALTSEGFKDVSPEAIQMGVDALGKVKAGLSQYFEAKPQRAVGINEFHGAVIPKDTPQATRDILARHGLETREYDPAIEHDRENTVAGLASDLHDQHGDVLFQGEPAAPNSLDQSRRASVTFGQNATIVRLFKDADASSFMHETGHIWLEEMRDMVADADAPKQMKADWQTTQNWFAGQAEAAYKELQTLANRARGKNKDAYREVIAWVDANGGVEAMRQIALGKGPGGNIEKLAFTPFHEQWARGFERYLYDGQAPSPGLARTFAQFRQWLTAIYNRIRGLAPINDDIRDVFDRLISVDPVRQPIADISREPAAKPLADIHEADAQTVQAPIADHVLDTVHNEVQTGASVDPITEAAVVTTRNSSAEAGSDQTDSSQPGSNRPGTTVAGGTGGTATSQTVGGRYGDDSAEGGGLGAAASGTGGNTGASNGPQRTRGPRPFSPVPREPLGLAAYLRSIGGVNDESSEVSHILGGHNQRPGLINNKTGIDLDTAALHAWEAGYFPEHGDTRPTINDLLVALKEDVAGRKRYSDKDAVQVEQYKAVLASNAEIDELAHQYGLPTYGITRAEFFDRLDLAMHEHDKLASAIPNEEFEGHVVSRDEAIAAEHEEAEKRRQAERDRYNDYFSPDADVEHTPRTLEDLDRELAGTEEQDAGGMGRVTENAGSPGPAAAVPPPEDHGTRGGGGGDDKRTVTGDSQGGIGSQPAANTITRPAPLPVKDVPESANQPFPKQDGRLIDKAGNIRLDNLGTPEDVNEVLRETASQNGDFYSARRGVLSDGEVMDLADAIGMDPSTLDRRAIGQAFNAEQIIAARKLLIQSATNVRDLMQKAFDDDHPANLFALAEARARHLMIQEQVSGITAEAGRALRAFRNIDGFKDAQELSRFLEQNTDMTLDQWQLFAKAGKSLPQPSQVSQFVMNSRNPDFGQQILFYYQNSLLSGPATHSRYAIGNIISAIVRPLVEVPMQAAAGKVNELITGRKAEVQLGEAGAQLFAIVKGAQDGLKAGYEAWQTGISPVLPGEKLHGTPMSAIPAQPSMFNTVIGVPMRSVAVIHSFFKSIGYAQNTAALAYRTAVREGLTGADFDRRVAQLYQEPTAAMRDPITNELDPTKITPEHLANIMEATAETLKSLYMEPTKYGGFNYYLGKAANANLLAKMIVPFFKIGANITKEALIERTPLGLLNGDIRDNALGRNGGAAADIQRGRIMFGTGLMATTAYLVSQGMATGDGPSDPNQRRIWLLSHRPNSIQIGSITIPYQGLGYTGMLMRFAANMTETAHGWDEETGKELAKSFFEGITKSVIDENFLRGVHDMTNAIYHPDQYGSAYLRSFATNFLPYSVGLGQIARIVDPVSRQVGDPTWSNAFGLMDSVKQHIPVVSQSLLPRRDVYGEAIGEAGHSYDTDPTTQQLQKLNIGIGSMPHSIKGVHLTDQQFDDYSRIAGRYTKMRLDALFQSPGWGSVPPFAQIETISKIIDKSRQAAAGAIWMQYPDIRQQSITAKQNDLAGNIQEGKRFGPVTYSH